MKTFAHGIHIPDQKHHTNTVPIRQFPFAPLMLIPLQQHIGNAAVAVVKEDQQVRRGQLLARADGFMSVPMHAPASGVIRKIGLVPYMDGRLRPGIFLQPHPGSTQEVAEGTPCQLASATPADIIDAIQKAGIVGLGGAAFPTHVKLKVPPGSVDTLLVNAAECEPYLTNDHRMMLEHCDDILLGIRYTLKATGARRAIIALEDNKHDAAEHLRANIARDLPIDVQELKVKYPQGAEKLLIKAVLDREVPSGGLPLHVGTVVVNVTTTAEIGRLLPHGRGIQERVITISGPAVINKGNYRVTIGTPVRFALEQVGVRGDLSEVFLGGPMMGPALANLDVPVVKGTSGIIAFSDKETAVRNRRTYPCIHCGHCVHACPMFLNPAQLGWLATTNDIAAMAEQHLLDCFECGICAFVCPAHIPLVQYFRLAKADWQRRKKTAENPEPRHEAR